VNRTVLTRLLSQVGFEVREAADGAEAVAQWRSWRPHLIWMDWRMSGVDGLEATRRIRAEEKGRRTPILALSASALDHERGQILAAGCDDFMAKTEALRVSGVGVTTAASGSEALELLATSEFDLVLMDLQMPDMRGIEAARRIKANPTTARLPVIAMSADTFDGESARLAETGMDDYVGKPVQPEVLARVVGRWLGRVG
jgi:CheY-like chemotaxis protein